MLEKGQLSGLFARVIVQCNSLQLQKAMRDVLASYLSPPSHFSCYSSELPQAQCLEHSWQCTWITLEGMMIGKALLSGSLSVP